MDSLSSNFPIRNYKDTISIYALIDPETEQVRYIGKSLNPQSRYSGHIRDHSSSQKTIWIQDLIKRGLKPHMRIIEEVPRDQGEMREIYWMNYYQQQGHLITNVTNNKIGERSISGSRHYESLRTFSRHVQLARRTYYCSKQSDQDIMVIKNRFGLSTDSDVIRFALQMLASADLDVELHVKKKLAKRRGPLLDIQHELF